MDEQSGWDAAQISQEQPSGSLSPREDAEREVQEWLEQFYYGLLNPVFKAAAKIQRALGMY